MYRNLLLLLCALGASTRLVMRRQARRLKRERNNQATITVELSRRGWDGKWQADATVTMDGKQYTGHGSAQSNEEQSELYAVWSAVHHAWSKQQHKAPDA